MCRRNEGNGHVGVALRKGCYADRLDNGSVTLCVHPHGDINLDGVEITLNRDELAIIGLLAAVIEEPPITLSVTDAQNIVMPIVVEEPPEADTPKPPVRTKPVVTPAKAPAKKVKH